MNGAALKSVAMAFSLSLSLGAMPALAGECKGNPGAIGTERTLTVQPTAYPMVGKLQYMETVRLRDKEVVLTFDDGPMEDHTEDLLNVLARECVKATFFMLGLNAAEYPAIARRVFDEGHTVGYHTFSHVDVEKTSFESAKADIKLGISAVKDALGPRRQPAPFYRPPYLSMTKELERHLVTRGLMIWSIDADSEDWKPASDHELINRTIERLEKVGKGILLMHDIQPITARIMPVLLSELQRRDFKIVHVVPDVPDTLRSTQLGAMDGQGRK